MAFCRYCGQQIPDNANACPYCGKFVNDQVVQQTQQPATPQQEAPQTYEQQAYQQPAQENVQQTYQPAQDAYQQNYQQPAQENVQQTYQPAQDAYQQNYQQPAQNNYPQTYQPTQGAQQGYGAPVQQPYVTPEMDVQQSRGIAWLSYLGLLFLIPMFVRKNSEYTRFHVKQGATLCAAGIAYGITVSILLAIIGAIFPGKTYYLYYSYYTAPSTVYTIFSILFNLGYIFFTVLAIIGIVNAASGKKKELPLIGKIPWIATLLDKTVYKN